MKVRTPLGEYPFEYRRVGRRADGIEVVGLVAGLESGVILGTEDARLLARRLGPPLVAAGALYLFRRAARSCG